MKNLPAILLLSTLPLLSCSVIDELDLFPVEEPEQGQDERCQNDHGEYYPCLENEMPLVVNQVQSNPLLYNIRMNFHVLSEYTEQMAMELKRDTDNLDIEEPIVVASFVYFDDNLKSTSALGNQLAEYFINDLQNIGLPVSDHKLSAGLIVNEQGDFSLSRNIEELNADIDIGYVLTGTMIQNPTGMVINARLIDRNSNKVIASATKLIPNLLIEDML